MFSVIPLFRHRLEEERKLLSAREIQNTAVNICYYLIIGELKSISIMHKYSGFHALYPTSTSSLSAAIKALSLDSEVLEKRERQKSRERETICADQLNIFKKEKLCMTRVTL